MLYVYGMSKPLTSEYIAKRFGGCLTTDLAHWREYGVTTEEELNDYLDMECAHNVFKDRNGYRPSFANVDEAREYLDTVEALP